MYVTSLIVGGRQVIFVNPFVNRIVDRGMPEGNKSNGASRNQVFYSNLRIE